MERLVRSAQTRDDYASAFRLVSAAAARAQTNGDDERVEIARDVTSLIHSVRRLSPRGEIPSRAAIARQDLWQQRIAASVRQEVEEVRRHVFGRPSAPFASWADASTWLRRQAPPDPARLHRRTTGTVSRLHGKMSSHAGRLKVPPQIRLEVRWEIAVLQVPPLGGIEARTWKLRALADAAKQIAGLTGWDEGDATAHILAGAIPHRGQPVVTFMNVIGPGTLSAWAKVRLQPWEATEAGMGRVLRHLHRFWKDRLRLSEKDARLLDLMRSRGFPPPGKGKGKRAGRSAYWRLLAKAWQEADGSRETLESLRKRWERLQRRAPWVFEDQQRR